MKRKLSDAEHMLWVTGQAMPISFATTARIKGAFTVDQLRKALSKVRRRHPLLAVRISVDDAGQPWFTSEGMPELPVRIVDGAQDDDWVQAVKEELAHPFSWETGPLVRFAWLRSSEFPDVSDLIAVCHHGIADGLSGAYLIRDIMHHLGNPDAAVAPLPELPPIDDLIPPEVERALTKHLLETMAQAPTPAPQEGKAPAAPLPELGPPKFWLTAWSLTEAQTAALAARAHQEQTTVHGALGAAFLLAFADLLGGETERVRRIQSPIDLRNRLSRPIGEGFGLFVTLAKTTVDCARGRGFWDIARDVKAGFDQEAVPEKLFGGYVMAQVLMATMPDFETAFENVVSQVGSLVVDFDLSLSNLGRLDLPTTYGSLQLVSLYGPTFSAMEDKIVGVTTIGGKMRFTFILRETTMAPSSAEQVRQLAMRYLEQAVRD